MRKTSDAQLNLENELFSEGTTDVEKKFKRLSREKQNTAVAIKYFDKGYSRILVGFFNGINSKGIDVLVDVNESAERVQNIYLPENNFENSHNIPKEKFLDYCVLSKKSPDLEDKLNKAGFSMCSSYMTL